MKNKIIYFLILFPIICFYMQADAGNANVGTRNKSVSKDLNKDHKISEAHKNKPTSKVDPEIFFKGYRFYEKKDYKNACSCFYNYLSESSPDENEHEWAEFFFGVSLKKLGFSHAAVDILAHLVKRKPNTKIVSYSLDMFEQISSTIPFDRKLIIDNVICDQEYGFVNQELADFIHFYQGLYDWEHGLFKWGSKHFGKITPHTYYYYKYQYQKALYFVYKNNVGNAIKILNNIIQSSCRNDLKDETRKTLARLLYEKGRYKEADFFYRQIQINILEQSQNLLERAWAHYRIGNPEKAMGLLYAFEAPSFENHFTPEYYILKSFIYKDVCHYQNALAVVTDFRERYGRSLKNIYHREKPEENHALMLVILNRKQINKTWKFLQLLEKEKTKCKEFKDQRLSQYLEKIYNLQIMESADVLRRQIEDEYEKIANQLLKYEEESDLMAYEIGLDMYQRVYKYRYKDEDSQKEEATDKIVVYPFQGEFWNDELADYKVILPDKCKEMEEWDIFFK